MKPSKSETTVVSDMQGEVFEMGVQQGSEKFLMSILTDIAEDSERYFLQEYAANGWDAKVEAGKTDTPLIVTTPSTFVQEVRIKDDGVGLNKQEIQETYSLYGASTKRERDDVAGVMGIGCKSALSYTSQFSVVGIKDGVRTMISVSRDEDGGGSMTVVEEAQTDEPNGVEIIIPTKRESEVRIRTKAERLFSFWKPGMVLLNGKEPIHVSGLDISPTMKLVKSEGYGTKNVVIMGNVPYDVPQEIQPFEVGYSGYYLVAWVPMGSVHFTPSREGLQITEKTKRCMNKLKAEFLQALTSSAQKEIDLCSSAAEAFVKAREWKSIHRTVEMGKLFYKNKEIPTQIKIAGKAWYSGNYKGAGQSTLHILEAQRTARSLFIEGWTLDKFTHRHREKAEKYCEEHKLENIEGYVLSGERINSEWVDVKSRAKWDDIRDIKLPKKTTVEIGYTQKPTGSYEGWKPASNAQSQLLAEVIDTTQPIYYFTPDMFIARARYGYATGPMDGRAVVTEFRKFEQHGTVIRMGSNRVKKFCRDFPKAQTVKVRLEELYKEQEKSTDKEDIEAYSIQSSHRDKVILESLDATKLTDPDLAKAVRLVDKTLGHNLQRVLLFHQSTLASSLNIGEVKLAKGYDVEDHYPLLNRHGYGLDAQHAIIYVNAAYKARKAGIIK